MAFTSNLAKYGIAYRQHLSKEKYEKISAEKSTEKDII